MQLLYNRRTNDIKECMSETLLHNTLVNPAAVIAVGAPDAFTPWLAQQRTSQDNPIKWLPQVLNDTAQTIAIETVRELQTTLSYKLQSQEGRDVVLLYAEKCSLPAQHALLKLLEEPPERVKFWLVTESPGSLLETIGSRCLMLQLPDLGGQDAVKDASSPETAPYLAALAANNPGKALSLVQTLGSDRGKAIALVTALLEAFRAGRAGGSTSEKQFAVAQQIACLEALDWLQANAHVGLTLDHLMITTWQIAHPKNPQPPVA